MLRRLHNELIKIPFWRKYQRRIARQIKGKIGIPDAWGILCRLAAANSDAVILDIGAHHGQTVERFVDETKNAIHAFEPIPDSFAKLNQRFIKNHQVHCHQLALSNSSGCANFYVNNNPQTSSLLKNDIGNTKNFAAQVTPKDTVVTPCDTLDHWHAKHIAHQPVIIKCDIQGAEKLFLDGARQTMQDYCLAFYSEIQLENMYQGQTNFWEVHNILCHELGFFLHEIFPCLHSAQGQALQADALWFKPSIAHQIK